MKEFTLKRILRSNLATLGILYDDNKEVCKTLENPWLNNHPSISCIPLGKYKCIKDNAGKFQYWKVLNVPNRSAIEIHNGNFERHTRGCVLFGKDWAFGDDKKDYPEPMTTSSKPTLERLKKELPSEYYISIINGGF